MGSEVLQGVNGALKDLTLPDPNVQKASAPSDASDIPLSKASADESAAAVQDSHRRSGRTRTVRVRDGFFDSSLLHYVSLDAAPKDAVLSRRSPKPSSKPPRSKTADESEDEEDWDGMMVGDEHQATNIPTCRPLPPKPSASEAKFLQLQPLYLPVEPAAEVVDKEGKVTKTRAGRAGVTCPMPPIGVATSSADFRYKWRWCKDSAAKRSLLSAAVDALDKQLGEDKVKKLGLEGLGFKLRETWQPQEELLFALGMCDKYRMFKYIRQCYLWNRTVHELNAYYHNVWKTRSTDLADEFLTMREEDATRMEYLAYVEKVRDQLVAIWDRKSMGDMPKLVKDMAAAAAAERAAPQAAAAGPARDRSKQRSSGRQVDVYASDSDDDFESDSSQGSDDSGRRAARKRAQQQKKRNAAAMSGGAIGKAAKRPTHSGGNSSGQGAYDSGRHRLQQQNKQRWGSLPIPGGSGLDQWLHPGQPKAQKPRTAFQRSAICTHAKLELPEMPKAPLPNPSNKHEVTAWLKLLPDFRQQLKSHLETVDTMTELAIEDCQRFIRELEEQRQAREDYAEQYIGILMQHGRSVLVKLEQAEQEADKQQDREAQLATRLKQEPQQQQEQDVLPAPSLVGGVLPAPSLVGAAAAAVAAAAGLNPQAVSSDQQQQPQQQQEQEQEKPEQGDVEMTDASAQPAAAAAADTAAPADGLQQQQQQQQQKEEEEPEASASAQQSSAGQDAVRSAMGPPASRAYMGPPPSRPHQREGVAADGQKQQGGEPQQQDTAAGADVGAAADLPFPGGPLLGGWSQWTGQQPTGPAAMPWLKHQQPINTPGAAAHKPIPRPYMHRTG